MKAIDDPNLAKKQFFIRIPGNYAELHEPFRNASKRIRFVGSRTSSVTRLGSLTVWRQLSAFRHFDHRWRMRLYRSGGTHRPSRRHPRVRHGWSCRRSARLNDSSPGPRPSAPRCACSHPHEGREAGVCRSCSQRQSDMPLRHDPVAFRKRCPDQERLDQAPRIAAFGHVKVEPNPAAADRTSSSPPDCKRSMGRATPSSKGHS